MMSANNIARISTINIKLGKMYKNVSEIKKGILNLQNLIWMPSFSFFFHKAVLNELEIIEMLLKQSHALLKFHQNQNIPLGDTTFAQDFYEKSWNNWNILKGSQCEVSGFYQDKNSFFWPAPGGNTPLIPPCHCSNFWVTLVVILVFHQLLLICPLSAVKAALFVWRVDMMSPYCTTSSEMVSTERCQFWQIKAKCY